MVPRITNNKVVDYDKLPENKNPEVPAPNPTPTPTPSINDSVIIDNTTVTNTTKVNWDN